MSPWSSRLPYYHTAGCHGSRADECAGGFAMPGSGWGAASARVAGPLQGLDEARHRGRQALAAPVDDGDGADEPRDGELDGGERPDLDLLQHRGPRQDADAGGDPDGLLDGLHVVELHDHGHAHAVLLEGAVDGSAHGEVVVEGHEGLAVEVGGGPPPPARPPPGPAGPPPPPAR